MIKLTGVVNSQYLRQRKREMKAGESKVNDKRTAQVLLNKRTFSGWMENTKA
jgi:hypothetical protein